MLQQEEIRDIASNLRANFPDNKYRVDFSLVIKNIQDKYGYIIKLYNNNFNPKDKLTSLPFFIENSGVVEKIKDKEFKITLSPYESESRRRFTTAHELGHIVLSHISSLNIGDKFNEPKNNFLARSMVFDRDSAEEREANIFAAELLMPSILIGEYFSNKDILTIQEIEDSARRFDVSKAAMMVRLNYLGYKF